MNLREQHYTNERCPLNINIYNTIAYFILLYFNINQIHVYKYKMGLFSKK